MRVITVAQRIVIMIAVAAVSLIVTGLVGLKGINSGTDHIKEIREESMANILHLTNLRQALTEIRVFVFSHAINTDAVEKNKYESQIKERKEAINRILKEAEKLVSGEEDKKLLEASRSAVNAYLDAIYSQFLPVSQQEGVEAAREVIINKTIPLGMVAVKTLDDLVKFNEKLAEDSVAEALAEAKTSKMIAEAVILIGLLIIGVLGYIVASEVRRRMNILSNTITGVSESLDFTTRIKITRLDELGTTADSFNKLLERMQGNLKTIAESTHTVASSAAHMSSTSTQVATAAHQQSAAASDMAATVEEMTVSINHVADRAEEASQTSSQSGRLADAGEKVIAQTAHDIQDISATVHQASDAIHRLEQQSQEIASVVAVIREIADQTNLLALNAAIEAARAGEQGRGFAVVADEVRKLAERTASSTQEIAHTIHAMRSGAGDAVANMGSVVDKVGLGVKRAEEANESMRQIGTGSRQAVGQVEEIASAIREQGAATNNIAIQVEKIAQMSEQSSAAAEESARSARDLDRLASDMQKIISTYRL